MKTIIRIDAEFDFENERASRQVLLAIAQTCEHRFKALAHATGGTCDKINVHPLGKVGVTISLMEELKGVEPCI